jgi:hypothetical protein
MKMNYSTTVRHREDTVRVAIDIEEESEPIEKRKHWYQPTVVIAEFSRYITQGSKSRSHAQPNWVTTFSIQGMRVLKAGGIGTQPAHLLIHDEDQFPWLRKAIDLAKEKFHTIISTWPDPQWPSEESLQIP